MSFVRLFGASAATFILAITTAGCSQNSAGGSTGSGGTIGVGGSPGSGGVASSGGSVGAGGATSTSSEGVGGAMVSSGGSVGTGGAAVGTGGGGAAGFLGSGGRTGVGGSARGGAAGGGVSGGSTGSTSNGGVVGSAGAAGAGAGGQAGGTSGTVVGGAGGGSNGDCTDASTTKLSFTKQYEDGSIAVTGSTKTYYTMTNWWHKFGGQMVGLEGLSMKIGNSAGTSVPASDGNPMGFPSIFIGAYSGHETVDSNLPKQVSAIKSVPTIFQTNASSLDTSNFNATYDVWFTASGGKLTSAMQSNPGKGGAYLMVWMYKPSDRQPRGGATNPAGGPKIANYTGLTVDGIPGAWDVWIDTTDPLCISYVSSTPIDGLAFDLNKFIQDSATKKYGITSSMYLNLVFAGFEIWSGGDGLQAKQFCAAVN